MPSSNPHASPYSSHAICRTRPPSHHSATSPRHVPRAVTPLHGSTPPGSGATGSSEGSSALGGLSGGAPGTGLPASGSTPSRRGGLGGRSPPSAPMKPASASSAASTTAQPPSSSTSASALTGAA